jgi:hypothetical protein
MIAMFARFYVNVLEPAFYIFLVVAVVAFLLYGFNLLRGGDKKNDLVSGIVNLIVKSSWKSMQLVGVALRKTLKVLLETISLLIATVRDFLTSKI